MTKKFPWARVMRFGLIRLALPSEQFWRTTLRELISFSEAPLRRGALDDLMKDYPDEK